MRNCNEGTFKGFTQLSKAYYGEVNLKLDKIHDEIVFGFYTEDGATTGEMVVQWLSLGGKIVPKWIVFSNAWNALSNFHDLIDLLGEHNGEDSSPKEFRNYLIKCGFKDITRTDNPYMIKNIAK